jgi:hypothetical protein
MHSKRSLAMSSRAGAQSPFGRAFTAFVLDAGGGYVAFVHGA